MEIKGTAVKTIPDFVKAKFPHRYEEWVSSLPEESKKIISSSIFANSWYPVEEAAVIPTKQIGIILYANNPVKAAWDSGRYSAEVGLTGIYKFFVKASSPSFIISLGGKILSTYYRPCAMKVESSVNNTILMHITKFPGINTVVENRVAGWVQKALEISGCKNVNVIITQSLTKGNPVTEYKITYL
jgi:hypothetical protein